MRSPSRKNDLSDATIAFADIAGFTALTEAHGDDHAATMLGQYYALAAASLCDGAKVVKHIGDAP